MTISKPKVEAAAATAAGGSLSQKNESPATAANKNGTSKRTVFLALVQITTITSLLGSIALKRYLSQGPYTPWTCSVFGYDCGRAYDGPFSGYVHEDYAAAEQAFKQNFYAGEEVGAAAAAYVNGELVLDMQGGWQDLEKRVPYTDKTLQMVFSSTKALTSIVVAQFVEKGMLSYDEKIATYWPEFAQGNKENVTLGDLMQHAAGVGYLENGVTTAEAEDPERFSRILAAQPHTFAGVRTRSYHATTRGWYVNEILKRVANCTVNDVAAELNKKYGIEWNLKPYQQEYDDRISLFYTGPKLFRMHRLIQFMGGFKRFVQVIFNPDVNFVKTSHSLPDKAQAPDAFPSLRLRRIEGPSYSGHTNARSIAKLAAMMANGGKAIVEGEPDLLNSTTYALATEPVSLDYDLLFRRSMEAVKGGWGCHDDFEVEGVQFVGWPGLGGSTFFWNQEHKIGFGYHMNLMVSMDSPDKRSMSILGEIVKQALKSKNNDSA